MSNTAPPIICGRCRLPVGPKWFTLYNTKLCWPCHLVDLARDQMLQVPVAKRAWLLLDLLSADDVHAYLASLKHGG